MGLKWIQRGWSLTSRPSFAAKVLYFTNEKSKLIAVIPLFNSKDSWSIWSWERRLARGDWPDWLFGGTALENEQNMKIE